MLKTIELTEQEREVLEPFIKTEKDLRHGLITVITMAKLNEDKFWKAIKKMLPEVSEKDLEGSIPVTIQRPSSKETPWSVTFWVEEE